MLWSEPHLLVIQPSPFCNIDCDYCYLRDRSNRGVMDVNTLNLIAERVVGELGATTATLVNWHAGEPTAVPLSWYRTAMRLLSPAKRGLPLHYSLQTNGVGITDQWAEFLAETKTDVGISIDGPESLHDRHRRTRNGRGTWRLGMEALERLRRHEIDPSVITVVTADTLDHAEELVEFYARHNIHRVSLNFEETEGANASSSLSSETAVVKSAQFLKSLLVEIIRRRLPLHVRETEKILSILVGGKSTTANNDQVVPLSIVTIDYLGGLYSFSPEFTEYATGEWSHLKLGNVHSHTLRQIANGAELRRLADQIAEGVARCEAACPIWRICGGGAPVNRLAETGSLAIAETQFCRLNIQSMVKALESVLALMGTPVKSEVVMSQRSIPTA
jgi:uncharacterized protein